ncbi:MAG: YolD-like family protein [Bacilli bacterium]
MRGMKKWQPFKSLKGQYEVLDEMKKERASVNKPELSEDECELIDRTIADLKRGQLAKVTFYHDHETITKEVVFDKLVPDQRRIYFFGFNIQLGDILHIQGI